MIGRPRITLMNVAAACEANVFDDTRISASSSPSSVLRMNEQKVISIVTTAPFSRIGRNSMAFWKNMASILFMLRTSLFHLPLLDDLHQGAVRLDLLDARVQLIERGRVAFAYNEAHLAHHFRLILGDQSQLRIRVVLKLVSDDRMVAEASLDAPERDVAHDVGHGIVSAYFLENAFLVQRIDKRRAYLSAYHFAFERVHGRVFAGVVGAHDESFAIRINRVREVDDLLACGRLQHGGRNNVDLLRGQRRN